MPHFGQEQFLNCRTREQLIAIAHETGPADRHSLLGKWKWAELVSALPRHAEQGRRADEPTEAQRKGVPGYPAR